MLRPDDRWLWDLWLLRTGATYHMFFLQAPKAIGDPDQRHWSATIGHATSTDLVHWDEVGTAIGPSDEPAWDDIATWTGCVVPRPDGGYRMFYTGIGSPDGRLVQRIGAADSTDLTVWRKAPSNPVSELGGPWYAPLDLGKWHNQGWRDPWVHPTQRGYQMLITARSASDGPARTKGVIARAHSQDLARWTVTGPLDTPQVAGDLEVPQLFRIEDRWYLLFCTHRWSDDVVERGLDGPTIAYFTGPSPDGPFSWDDQSVLTTPENGLFGGRVVEGDGGKPYLLAWQRTQADGTFGGYITDPMELTCGPDGRLRVQ